MSFQNSYKPIVFSRPQSVDVACTSTANTQYDYWLRLGRDFRHLRIRTNRFYEPIKVYAWVYSGNNWMQVSYSKAIFEERRALVLVESIGNVLFVKSEMTSTIWEGMVSGLSEHREYQLAQLTIPAADLRAQS